MSELSLNRFQEIIEKQRLEVQAVALSEGENWGINIASQYPIFNLRGMFFRIVQGRDNQGVPTLLYQQIEPNKNPKEVTAFVTHVMQIRNGVEGVLITISSEAGAQTEGSIVFKPYFQGSRSNSQQSGWAPDLKADEQSMDQFQAKGKGGHAIEKNNAYSSVELEPDQPIELKENQMWISLDELAQVCPEYLGEHLRYVLGASLFPQKIASDHLDWNYKYHFPLYSNFIPEEGEQWVRGEGSVLLQHSDQPDEHSKVEFIECKGPDLDWKQPIIHLKQWKLEDSPSVEGHDMAVAVRACVGGKMLYLMRPEKELGIEKPLVTGALFAKMNVVEKEPLWESLKDKIIGQTVREPMDGSRLSGWRHLAAIELSEEEKNALNVPEGYTWLTENQVAHLLEKEDLQDGFLEACSLFKLKKA